jgi:3-dehydroquinate synthase
MKRIKVNTQTPYEVIVGEGAINHLAPFVMDTFSNAANIAIVADSNVEPLYADKIERLLTPSAKRIERISFKAGEKSKTLETYALLLSALASFRFSRKDIIIALGGGVTGDLAGFAASSYMRGIDFIQIPTSLLAMVDSSVGGKTGVNLDEGKNLAGAFHQPRAVFCDTSFLKTLPEIWRIDAMGEVLKYAVLADPKLFSRLENAPTAEITEDEIARCISIKRDIVEIDEKESGERKLLNLGHTYAHAIEKESDFSISHGRAVATGIALASQKAFSLGLLSKTDLNRIISLVEKMGYKSASPFDENSLLKSMLIDKKAENGEIDFVLPTGIGKCTVKRIKL